jgi:hypothetical protein
MASSPQALWLGADVVAVGRRVAVRPYAHAVLPETRALERRLGHNAHLTDVFSKKMNWTKMSPKK